MCWVLILHCVGYYIQPFSSRVNSSFGENQFDCSPLARFIDSWGMISVLETDKTAINEAGCEVSRKNLTQLWCWNLFDNLIDSFGQFNPKSDGWATFIHCLLCPLLWILNVRKAMARTHPVWWGLTKWDVTNTKNITMITCKDVRM